MPSLDEELQSSFAAVFPALRALEIPGASTATVAGWDSLATMRLVIVIEEQFGIEIAVEDLPRIVSYAQAAEYLRGRLGRA